MMACESQNAAFVRFCMIGGTKQVKVCKLSRANLRQIIRGVSIATGTGAEPHKNFIIKREQSSAA